ncbi:SpoIIE family protein phosphatase [Streptantibioticus parmotrematis]|uniref:SpoIIE family protein phosphatase n=1 Tax=Streptantibioticus parmotrematis TaxID=2873249 RepID=UPI00340EAA6D
MRDAQAAFRALQRSGTAEPVADTDLDTLLRLLQRAFGTLGVHGAALYTFTTGDQVMELVTVIGLPLEFVTPWERVGVTTPAPVTDAVRRADLVWVGGEDEMVRRYPRIAMTVPYPFSLAALPLTADGTTYGAIFLTWPAARAPLLSPVARERLWSLAGRLASVLRRASRAGTPVHAGAHPLGVLPDGGAVGSEEALTAMVARLPEGMCGLDLGGCLTYVTPGAADLLGAPARRLLGAQPWTVLPWLRDPVYEDRYRAALISREPTSFVALRPPDHWLSFHLYPDGTGLTVRINEAEVTQGDQDPLPRVEPAQAPVEPTRAGVLYHLLHLASALTEAAGVQDVVDLVADQIVPAFGGDGVAILTTEGGRLRTVGHRGYAPGVVESFDNTPLTAPTPGARALHTGAPSFFESRAELERLYPSRFELRDGMSAWAYLPLVASGRLVGTCVLAYAEPHVFAFDERAILTSLGGLIAQALDRARLYDTKMELAQGLQESLLPHALPLLPGLETAARYLPSTEGLEVGGDFYDLIRTDRDTATAVIGDVEGHNVAAAALMGQIRTAVHAYARAGAQPDAVLVQINRLMADLDSTLLASAACLRVDLARREALLANAGHPPPLLRTPDGKVRTVDLPGGPGMVLGVDPGAQYGTVRVPLPPGTVLAMYTDGLVDRPGVDMTAAQAALADRLARFDDGPLDDQADPFMSQALPAEERTDDVALLLLRSTPR